MYSKNTPDRVRVAVIGGGAAGMTAAIFAAQSGADVIIIERNNIMGKKLRITGKGRCNLTNLCELDEFLSNVPTNPKFLYKAFSTLKSKDTMEFFESLGIPLKVERGNRVFPVSDKAKDIVDALEKKLHELRVNIIRGRVSEIETENGFITAVKCENNSIDCDRVIICTGGASYTACGSTGDGYELARKFGHTIIPLKPSLVPLVSQDKLCRECMGLSLKNVGCGFYDVNSGKELYYEQGEMLFAHFGITGPIALSASAHLKKFPVIAKIDLKPALDTAQLDRRVLRDFEEQKNKEFRNSLSMLLPNKLIAPIIKLSGINTEKRVNEITREERQKLVSLLKGLEIKITGTRPLNEAIITSGGVSVKEIDPSTMQSKLQKNLFFAGEVIDSDAYTGGFNLQIAFSTAKVAGEKCINE
ncbi:MAG TPA: aminoacetone oxidase family FAD-binding enzyme [Clostridiales bacterium]|nr:aminoacetone oxidase family FAD-binding enzyme [Clostridiales bacterium]